VSLAVNEQVKLTATALNSLAVATVIAGLLSPIVALGNAEPSQRIDSVAVTASFVWLLIGVILHLCGRLTLLGVEE
jgi:hypothetical protein